MGRAGGIHITVIALRPAQHLLGAPPILLERLALPRVYRHAAGLVDRTLGADSDRRAEGRFALYTSPDPSDGDAVVDPPTRPVSVTRAHKPAAKSAVPAPPVADELDYETLTLAQLRARLQTLDVDELEALLAYEEATKARAPFQTLLANRITRATAK